MVFTFRNLLGLLESAIMLKELGDSVKRVYLNLSISDANITFKNYTGPIFKSFSWVKISGRQSNYFYSANWISCQCNYSRMN